MHELYSVMLHPLQRGAHRQNKGMGPSLRDWIARRWVRGLFQNQFYVQQSTATGRKWHMTYKHFHLFNCILTAQLSYIFRIGGTGQQPATIWFSQVGKENIFSSCQVLQARCENQPCKPTWSTWYHTGCMGTRAGGFLEHRNRSREHAGCAGASRTAQPTREANP